jgi:hypothetical protein
MTSLRPLIAAALLGLAACADSPSKAVERFVDAGVRGQLDSVMVMLHPEVTANVPAGKVRMALAESFSKAQRRAGTPGFEVLSEAIHDDTAHVRGVELRNGKAVGSSEDFRLRKFEDRWLLAPIMSK